MKTETADMQMTQNTIRIHAVDVTGTFTMEGDYPATATASSVTKAIAATFGMPSDAPYALRGNRGEWLVDDQPIGEQLDQSTSEVTITPRTHLGAGQANQPPQARG